MSPWMGVISMFGGTPPEIDFESMHPYMNSKEESEEPKETAEEIKTGWKTFVRATKEKDDGRRSK